VLLLVQRRSRNRSTEIAPPPHVSDIPWALLVASTDDVLLLVLLPGCPDLIS
jgi:hypothetical protein